MNCTYGLDIRDPIRIWDAFMDGGSYEEEEDEDVEHGKEDPDTTRGKRTKKSKRTKVAKDPIVFVPDGKRVQRKNTRRKKR